MIRHPLLDQAARAGIRLGLERMRDFLAELGDPHLRAPSVHVAGTNGKGSVCAFVTRVLIEAGYRVGTTISPHLEHVNERIQLGGVPVSDARLEVLLHQVDQARTPGELTYYEMALAAAFLAFAEARVDVQVVEVGLGGRLDATNLVRPVVCAVPHIGLDHQAILGNTLAEIAREKAGIFKRGAPVVLGPSVPEARQALVREAEALGCPWWGPPALHVDRHGDGTVTIHTPAGSVGPVRLGLSGAHQGWNASVAVGVVHQMRARGFAISHDALVRGLESAFVAGRIERVMPGLLLDGAHNPDGARALAEWLAAAPRPSRRTLLFGMGDARDPHGVVAPLVPHVDAIVTTRCSHPRAREPEELASMIAGLHPSVSAAGPIEQALPQVVHGSDETVVAGSLFVVGAARALVAEGALEPGKEAS